MTDRQLLGIDIGGSMVKAAVFSEDGQMLGGAGHRSVVIDGPLGHAERDQHEMWRSAAEAIRATLAAPDVDAGSIIGVGVTGFGNGLFLVDPQGRPTRNGIAAVDTRGAATVEAWRANGMQEHMYDTTLQPFWAGQPLPLIEWVRNHEPAALEQAHRFLTSKDVIRFHLTGLLSTDTTDLSSGGLLDHRTGLPAHDLFATLGLGVVSELIPDEAVKQPDQIVGTVTPGAAQETGLIAGTPVVSGSMDGLALLIGSGVSEVGELSVIGGTWGINQTFATEHVTDRSVFQSLPSHQPGKPLIVESTPNAMSNFEWYVQQFVKLPADLSSDDLYDHCTQRMLESDQLGDDPLVFLPHIYATPRHPLSTGSILGVTASTGQDQLLRAVFEGIVFEHRVFIERLPGIALQAPVRIAGGVVNSPTWLQLFADVLNRRIETPDTPEVGARGAAMLAAVGVGVHADHAAASQQMTAVGEIFNPQDQLVQQLEHRYQRFRALRPLVLDLPI